MCFSVLFFFQRYYIFVKAFVGFVVIYFIFPYCSSEGREAAEGTRGGQTGEEAETGQQEEGDRSCQFGRGGHREDPAGEEDILEDKLRRAEEPERRAPEERTGGGGERGAPHHIGGDKEVFYVSIQKIG